MSVARLNMSHGTYEFYIQLLSAIRKVNKKNGFNIRVLLDLEGPRIRIGFLKTPFTVNDGDEVYMAAEHLNVNGAIPFDFPGSISEITKGMDVFVDDGNIHLIATGHSGRRLKLRVIKGGVIKSRKGVNIPKFKIKNRIISEKDRLDIEFGIENKADMIAQSFVTDSNDIKQVVRLVKEPLPECQIIAKLENAEGIKNVEKIIESCDGIMVARGDMGVSLPMYKIPIIQKYIIRQCNRKKKSVIVATQMLESMIDNPRPTRAEVSDIANAILDGTDYVMLSAESAVGKYPVECVDLMQQIIVFTEQYEARGI